MSRFPGICITILIAASITQAAPTTAPVRGRLVTPDGKPPVGARAWVVSGETPETVTYLPMTIDAAGWYSGSTQDAAALVVDAPGYGLYVRGLSIESGRSAQDFRLGRATRLRLTVVDLQGQPAAKVRLHLLPYPAVRPLIGPNMPADLRDRLIQTSDDNGVCTFEQVRQEMPVSFEVLDTRFAMPDLGETVPIGQQDVTEGTLRLGLAARIAGMVAMADSGKGVAGVRITATPIIQGGEANTVRPKTMYATTDTEGRFEVGQLMPRVYTLSAELPPPTNSEYGVPGRGVMGVVAGMRLEGQSLSVVRAGTLRGRVTRRSDGEPLAGATVNATEITQVSLPGTVLTSSLNIPVPRTTTAADGTYQFTLAPGTYIVSGASAQATGLVVQEGQVTIADLSSNPRTATPRAGSITVRGRVLDSRGNRVPGVMLRAASVGTETSARGTSDENGEFTIDGAPPDSELYAIGDVWTSLQPVRIEGKEGPFDLVVYEDQFASARVTVLDEAGNPIPGAQTRLVTYHGATRLSDLWREPLAPDATWTYRWLPPHHQIEVFAVSPVHSQVISRATLEPGKQTEIIMRLPPGTGRGIPRGGGRMGPVRGVIPPGARIGGGIDGRGGQ